ncbi:MAG TPA: YdcF family protein [Acidimicrobiales bacterium]|jgi:uncharacterized SAM-binding protein YcdF (DUF218 family)|nr:YdcF family protein [Acidimicrobiales bacterium]
MSGPLAALLFTLIIGAAGLFVVARFTKRLVLRLVAAFMALVVGYFGVTFLQVWGDSYRVDHGNAQAIVVLGAAQYNGRPSPDLAARLEHALALWRQGVAPIIVVTGGRQPGDRYTEATTGYDYLRARGVPDTKILKEVNGGSTYESLAASAGFLRPRGITKVMLVSDDYHSARLLAIAHEVHLTAQVSPAPDQRSTAAELHQLGRETVALGIGRVIGFRRLDNR